MPKVNVMQISMHFLSIGVSVPIELFSQCIRRYIHGVIGLEAEVVQ